MVSARPRDRILTTATELFHSEGIGAVGVNRIIGQADVAPMTLYRQFGNKDNLVAAALEQWSTSWLHRLADAMDRRGDDPSDRFDGLWDELQAWFAEEPFRGSFVANAATELRSEPHHPAQTRIAQHRQALRQLLEDLAKSAGAYDPTVLAAQLQILIDGAIASAVGRPRPQLRLRRPRPRQGRRHRRLGRLTTADRDPGQLPGVTGHPRVAVDQRPGHGPLDQREELAGERRRVARPGRAGQVLEQPAEGLTVPDQDGVGGRAAAVGRRDHRRGQRRAGEVVGGEPSLERVPERVQGRLWRVAAAGSSRRPAR